MAISFTKSKLPWGWLGNMSPFQIDAGADGVWRTAEAKFQADRFTDQASGMSGPPTPSG